MDNYYMLDNYNDSDSDFMEIVDPDDHPGKDINWNNGNIAFCHILYILPFY